MLIFPAIDLLNGKCVRLYKGDYNTSGVVAQDAIQTAFDFKASGAKHIHMVDLDGAKGDGRKNSEIIKEVSLSSGLFVQSGGGIRNMHDAERMFNNGVKRIIIGSAAVKNPDFVKEAIKEFSSSCIAVGLDAKNGNVMTEGWIENSGQNYIDLARKMVDVGVNYLIVTDIDKDGTLEGVNVEMLKTLGQKINVNIVASGGIKDINDIKSLTEANLYGAICGKSLYSGKLKLSDAIKVGGSQG